jgi:hypothetical protein
MNQPVSQNHHLSYFGEWFQRGGLIKKFYQRFRKNIYKFNVIHYFSLGDLSNDRRRTHSFRAISVSGSTRQIEFQSRAVFIQKLTIPHITHHRNYWPLKRLEGHNSPWSSPSSSSGELAPRRQEWKLRLMRLLLLLPEELLSRVIAVPLPSLHNRLTERPAIYTELLSQSSQVLQKLYTSL